MLRTSRETLRFGGEGEGRGLFGVDAGGGSGGGGGIAGQLNWCAEEGGDRGGDPGEVGPEVQRDGG